MFFRFALNTLSENGRMMTRRGFASAAATMEAKAPISTTELPLTFASPIKAIYANVMVKQVDAPGMSCSVGIMPIHVPTLVVLKPGVVKVHELDGTVNKFFVSSGSLSMNLDGSCQILAEEVSKLDELDEKTTKAMHEENMRQTSDVKLSDVEKAEAAIRVDVADAVLKALSEK